MSLSREASRVWILLKTLPTLQLFLLDLLLPWPCNLFLPVNERRRTGIQMLPYLSSLPETEQNPGCQPRMPVSISCLRVVRMRQFLPSCALSEVGLGNETDLWERLNELEQTNAELKQRQLEFEREKYQLTKKISQLKRKIKANDMGIVHPSLPQSLLYTSSLFLCSWGRHRWGTRTRSIGAAQPSREAHSTG